MPRVRFYFESKLKTNFVIWFLSNSPEVLAFFGNVIEQQELNFYNGKLLINGQFKLKIKNKTYNFTVLMANNEYTLVFFFIFTVNEHSNPLIFKYSSIFYKNYTFIVKDYLIIK